MPKQIQSTFAARCTGCDAPIAVGGWCYYDATQPRGRRTRCLNCKPGDTPVAEDSAAELATLKRKLAAMEATEAPKTPATPVRPATGDPLAAAIAAAVEPLITGKLDKDAVMAMIREVVTPPVHTITVQVPDMPAIDMGRQHRQFEQLLLTCNARTRNGRLNVWITGPAGTGKTTAAENVAKALKLKFAATGSLVETYKLFGFMAPGTGEYVSTPFRQIWECGGVFIFDDFDGSDPVAAIELNNALANGYCTFPDGSVQRHAGCVLILTANTWGVGATNEYVGRAKQDAAFLDRFVGIDWQIDEDLERDTCPNAEWVTIVQRVRANVKTKGMRVLVTPRASYYGAALLAGGLPLDTVKAMTLQKSMTAEQWRSVC